MIRAKAIVEVVGKPKEHVEETLNVLIKNIADDNKVKLEQREVYEAKEVQNFFSAFAEVDVLFEETRSLIDFCFDYMPSSIDIIEPGELRIDSKSLSLFLNDLTGRLHSINAKMANKNAESKIMMQNAETLLSNLLKMTLKDPKSLDEITGKVGIKKQKLQAILGKYTQMGKVTKKDGKYVWVG